MVMQSDRVNEKAKKMKALDKKFGTTPKDIKRKLKKVANLYMGLLRKPEESRKKMQAALFSAIKATRAIKKKAKTLKDL